MHLPASPVKKKRSRPVWNNDVREISKKSKVQIESTSAPAPVTEQNVVMREAVLRALLSAGGLESFWKIASTSQTLNK